MLQGENERVMYSVSPIDHIERIIGLRKVTGYPIYASVGFSTSVVFADWHQQLRTTVLMIVGACLAGLGLTSAIRRREAASREVERHRQHLEALVLERTADLSIAKDAAESANRAKSAFLDNMSHELRTPMHGVMAMIDVAKRRMADPKGLDQLDRAKTAATHLLAILNDILDLSKIEAERMELESVPLQLDDTIQHISAAICPQAEAKSLRLTLVLPQELAHLPLTGDPLRLGQILFNLLDNAIKFTPQGEVSLRIDLREETADSALIRFEVSDTGIGIEPEAQSRLFNSFEQADNSMSRRYGGTGLGLAICKRLTELMGGRIGMESTPGQGSTFWFMLPMKKLEPEPIIQPMPSVQAI
jgi:signal transduction histidine kinase